MEIFDNIGHKEGYQQVGDRKTLYVNPDKPEDFYAEGDKLTQTLVIVFRLVGIVLLMALVAVLLQQADRGEKNVRTLLCR